MFNILKNQPVIGILLYLSLKRNLEMNVNRFKSHNKDNSDNGLLQPAIRLPLLIPIVIDLRDCFLTIALP